MREKGDFVFFLERGKKREGEDDLPSQGAEPSLQSIHGTSEPMTDSKSEGFTEQRSSTGMSLGHVCASCERGSCRSFFVMAFNGE